MPLISRRRHIMEWYEISIGPYSAIAPADALGRFPNVNGGKEGVHSWSVVGSGFHTCSSKNHLMEAAVDREHLDAPAVGLRVSPRSVFVEIEILTFFVLAELPQLLLRCNP